MAFVFVDSTASGANDGSSWTDAYTSLNTALVSTNITPGDVILVSGTFTETVTITEAGTTSAVYTVLGDDKSGGAGRGNPATFTIDGQSTRANCLTTSLGAGTNALYCFRDMRCTGATSHNIDLGNLRHVTYKDCRSDNSGGDGWNVANSAHFFQNCTSDNNTGLGILMTYGLVCGGKIHSNGGIGISSVGAVVFSTVFYNNTGQDWVDSQTSGLIVGINLTVDADGLAGAGAIDFSASSHRGHALVNTIIVNADGTSGVGFDAGNDLGEVAISANNLLNDNTANYANTATFDGEVLTAPGFVNQASDDYNLSGSGDADGAGFAQDDQS